MHEITLPALSVGAFLLLSFAVGVLVGWLACEEHKNP